MSFSVAWCHVQLHSWYWFDSSSYSYSLLLSPSLSFLLISAVCPSLSLSSTSLPPLWQLHHGKGLASQSSPLECPLCPQLSWVLDLDPITANLLQLIQPHPNNSNCDCSLSLWTRSLWTFPLHLSTTLWGSYCLHKPGNGNLEKLSNFPQCMS